MSENLPGLYIPLYKLVFVSTTVVVVKHYSHSILGWALLL